MKKLLFLSAVFAISASAFAKHVDVTTAKKAGYQFLAGKTNIDAVRDANGLDLAYTAEANGTQYFYVFNAGEQAFVMVSAEDNVNPVFGYSTEGGFVSAGMPAHIAYWLENYVDQIKYVKDNNIQATEAIEDKWAALLEGKGPQLKTTATAVAPILLTSWNQSPKYNDMCPADPDAGGDLSVVGCVATAMSQIMKYWNYPQQGLGSLSYDVQGPIGIASANFGATTYKWGSMPIALGSTSTQAQVDAVALLCYHAGVSVKMMYGADASGSYSWLVADALKDYFNYAASTEYVERSSYTDAQWIALFKKEIDALRPVYYSGSGSGGGHAWVADGYDANDFLHINWGWGGSSNGYFEIDAMNPSSLGTGGGSGGFNYNQAANIGIVPPNVGTPDKYENNNGKETAYTFPLSFSGNTASIKTDGATFHATNDGDYYKVHLPVGDNYTISGRAHDMVNSGNGNTYTADVDFAFSKTGVTYSTVNDDVMAAGYDVNNGGDVIIRVRNKNVGTMGSYMLDLAVTKHSTGINDVNNMNDIIVYPNPASTQLNIKLSGLTAEVTLVDLQGRTVQSFSTSNQDILSIPTNDIANGLYFVQIKTVNGTTIKKVTIGK